MKRCSILLVLALAAACLPADPGVQLDGRTFLSTGVTEAGAERSLVAGTSLRIGFDEGRLSASAGCNSMSGGYRIDGGRLVTDGLAMTEMGCDAARHDQDEWFADFLGSRPQVRLSGDDLTLEGGGTVIRLLDRETAEPDLPLTGTTWTVDSIITGETVSSVPAGVVATIVIAENGRVTIGTGCNEGAGSVVIESDTLRFGDLVVTKRACEGPAGAMEEHVLAVLGADVVAYEIEAARLSLTAGNRGLVARGR